MNKCRLHEIRKWIRVTVIRMSYFTLSAKFRALNDESVGNVLL